MRKILIAPSLLSADFMHLEREIQNIEAADADILHLDVMDGHFVPNLTFGMPIIRQIRAFTKLPLDVHLMVQNPGDYYQPLAQCGVEYVSFHQEAVTHIHRHIYVLRDAGIQAGIALNPATPISTIQPVLPDLDFVLFMSVNPGFGGQKFLPLVYDKITQARLLTSNINPTLKIEIDGGVTDANSEALIDAGADMLVAGSHIFGNPDYTRAIASLRQ